MKKNSRNTKGKIISAAWHLFYEQGYDNTTVDDIIFESETSKGSFYHYFNGKDALLSTLMTTIEKSHTDSAISPQNRLSAAVGMAVFNAARDEDSDSVFRRADNVMYENKKAMKAVRVD